MCTEHAEKYSLHPCPKALAESHGVPTAGERGCYEVFQQGRILLIRPEWLHLSFLRDAARCTSVFVIYSKISSSSEEKVHHRVVLCCVCVFVCVTRACVWMYCVNCCCSFSSCHLVGDLTPKPNESIKSSWNIFLALDWFKALCSHQRRRVLHKQQCTEYLSFSLLPCLAEGSSINFMSLFHVVLFFVFLFFLLFLFTAKHMT